MKLTNTPQLVYASWQPLSEADFSEGAQLVRRRVGHQVALLSVGVENLKIAYAENPTEWLNTGLGAIDCYEFLHLQPVEPEEKPVFDRKHGVMRADTSVGTYKYYGPCSTGVAQTEGQLYDPDGNFLGVKVLSSGDALNLIEADISRRKLALVEPEEA